MEDEKIRWRSVALTWVYVLWCCFIASRLPSILPVDMDYIFWVAIVMLSYIGAVHYCARGYELKLSEQRRHLEGELHHVRAERHQLAASQPKLVYEQGRIQDQLKHVLFLLHSDTPECREVRRHVTAIVNRLS